MSELACHVCQEDANLPRPRALQWRRALSMSAFHHLTEAHALALGGVPMAFLRNETSHSRRDSAPSARQPRHCVATV